MLIRFSLVCGISLCVLLGCSNKPSRIEAPSWDPDGFADAIIEKLDKNGDASLDQTELAGTPGLAWGAVYIDADQNKSLSRDELVARFERYVKMRVGLTSKQIQLSYKGRPLGGAKVTLVPEFFLDGVIEPAMGEAPPEGVFSPITQGAEVPGVRAGYYRVVVESPNVKIPAKYGSAESTPLGVEISSLDSDTRSYGTIQLALRD